MYYYAGTAGEKGKKLRNFSALAGRRCDACPFCARAQTPLRKTLVRHRTRVVGDAVGEKYAVVCVMVGLAEDGMSGKRRWPRKKINRSIGKTGHVFARSARGAGIGRNRARARHYCFSTATPSFATLTDTRATSRDVRLPTRPAGTYVLLPGNGQLDYVRFSPDARPARAVGRSYVRTVAASVADRVEGRGKVRPKSLENEIEPYIRNGDWGR